MKNYLNTNSGLKADNIFKFSLPVKKTCIGAKECLKFCYGKRGMYRIHADMINKAHARNFEFSKSKEFELDISLEIFRRKLKIIRIHDTGDFYSQAYLNKWVRIVKMNPNTRFYAYTKSLRLDFSEFNKLKNTKIIQSFGGKYDDDINTSQPHARVFKDEFILARRGYVDCSSSDLTALTTANPYIGLVVH